MTEKDIFEQFMFAFLNPDLIIGQFISKVQTESDIQLSREIHNLQAQIREIPTPVEGKDVSKEIIRLEEQCKKFQNLPQVFKMLTSRITELEGSKNCQDSGSQVDRKNKKELLKKRVNEHKMKLNQIQRYERPILILDLYNEMKSWREFNESWFKLEGHEKTPVAFTNAGAKAFLLRLGVIQKNVYSEYREV